MSTVTWDRLPCGTYSEGLLTYAADRLSPTAGSHAAGCPYCRAAITELTQLWAPVRQWGARDVLIPEGFVLTVMNRVRRLVQSPRHVSEITARGTTTVTSWVLGLIASNATRETDGTTERTGRSASADRPHAVRYGADDVAIDELGAQDIAVTLGITARPVPSLVDLADTVRHNIVTAIYAETRIHAAEVNITIDDLDLADGAPDLADRDAVDPDLADRGADAPDRADGDRHLADRDAVALDDFAGPG